MSYIERYAKYFEVQNLPFLLIEGKLFRLYSQIIMPEGPAIVDYTISAKGEKALLQHFRAPILRITRGFKSSKGSGYFAVICKEFTSLEALTNKKIKYEISRAIRLCTVRKMEATEAAELAFPVYVKAIRSYKNFSGNIPAESDFKNNLLKTKEFGDIVHYWGVFYEGELCGYATNYVYGKTEVNYSVIKYNPEFFNKGISYALIYRMNEYYLGKEGFEYASDGYMSLLHDSNIQSYLQKNFGFFKQRIHLDLRWKFPYSWAIRVLQPFSGILEKFDPRIKALFRLNSLNDGSKKVDEPA